MYLHTHTSTHISYLMWEKSLELIVGVNLFLYIYLY